MLIDCAGPVCPLALIAQIYDWPKLNKANYTRPKVCRTKSAGGRCPCAACPLQASPAAESRGCYRIGHRGWSPDFLFHSRRLTK